MGKKAKRKSEKRVEEGRVEVKKDIYKTSFIQNPLLHCILILIVGFICYSNSFNVPFQWDEGFFIVDNPIVKDISYFLDYNRAKQFGNQYNHFIGRYVGYLTFALNYKIHGVSVTGYHIVNLLIHAINALLVYYLVLLTFRTPFLTKSLLKLEARYIALFSALFFISHPLQTEAVTYIFQRLASLAALFYTLSLIFYIKSRLSEEKAEQYSFLALSLIATVFAMKTKENAFTLPLVIALYEFFFFTGEVRGRIVRLIPFLLTLFIIPLTLIGIDKPVGEIIASVGPATVDSTGVSRWDYFITQFRVVATYIRLLFLPINQNLDYMYSLSGSFADMRVIGSLLLLICLAGLAFYLYYRSSVKIPDLRIAAFGIFWFFITLSVESSIIPLQTTIDEYRVYLPSAGFIISIIIGIFLFALRSKNTNIRYLIMSILIVMVLLTSYLSYTRNSIWASKISLWEDVVKKSPESVRARNNLGNAYMSRGATDNAIEQYAAALKLNPDFSVTHNNICNAYMSKGLLDKAIEHCIIALKINPDQVESHINLGSAYKAKGLIDKAIEHYNIALGMRPDFAGTYNNLGNAYMMKGMADKAIEYYNTNLKLDPDSAKTHNNLGNAYAEKGQADKAIEHYNIALKLDPDSAKTHNNLGNAYLTKGLFDKAIEHYNIALKLNPDLSETHFNLGTSYFKKGLTDKALEEFRTTLKLNPSFNAAKEYIYHITKANKKYSQSSPTGGNE
jgi:protein O-mannosyl-transferase